jgi:hypothetical protein
MPDDLHLRPASLELARYRKPTCCCRVSID